MRDYNIHYMLFNYIILLACAVFINFKQFKLRFKSNNYLSIFVIFLSCLTVYLILYLDRSIFVQEIILIITCTVLFSSGFWHVLYSNLILIQISTLIDILLMIMLILANASSPEMSVFVLVFVRSAILYTLCMLGYIFSLKRYILTGMESYKNQNILIVACIFISLLHAYSIYNCTNLAIFGFTYPDYELIHSFIVNLLFIIMTFLNIIFINIMLKNRYLEHDNKFHQKNIDLQFNHYKLLEGYLFDTKTLIHDHKQHLLIIKMLIERNQIDKLENYVNGLVNDFSKVKRDKSCENLILDAIIQSKIHECMANNIKYSYNINVSPNINIKDSDLVIVFGNLLTNAIEACLKIKSKDVEKYIHININTVNGILVANIVNSKKNKIKKRDDLFKTSKKDSVNHGLGLSSVSNVVSKYNGNILFDYDLNKFEVKLMMHV